MIKETGRSIQQMTHTIHRLSYVLYYTVLSEENPKILGLTEYFSFALYRNISEISIV